MMRIHSTNQLSRIVCPWVFKKLVGINMMAQVNSVKKITIHRRTINDHGYCFFSSSIAMCRLLDEYRTPLLWYFVLKLVIGLFYRMAYEMKQQVTLRADLELKVSEAFAS